MREGDVRGGVVPEARLTDFAELAATAIANAEARAELTASRARIVATTDQARRRIERDLHDGAQQRLVSVALRPRTAAAAIPPEEEVHQELAGIGSELDDALADLRELSRGIHPAILSEGGLGPALRTLARRSSVPVELQIGTEGRLPERIEVAAYYVVAEALANVAKHAGASVVQVDVDADDGLLRLAIRDDGVGGADPARRSGLVGLKDRVEATGGTLRVESRRGQGTRLLVELGADASQPTSLTWRARSRSASGGPAYLDRGDELTAEFRDVGHHCHTPSCSTAHSPHEHMTTPSHQIDRRWCIHPFRPRCWYRSSCESSPPGVRMAAGRADAWGWVGEPDAMTVAVNTQRHATGRTTVDGQPAQRPRHPGRWRALWVSLFAAFMTLLDTSIVNVALPSIERDLGAAAASAQWVISGYALAFGLALVPAGRLGDVLGRRRMFLFALSAFVVTSALSGAAPTTGLLIAARLLQGVAGGMLIPQNSGLIQELFTGAERGRAFGFLGATVGLATAAGPVIGGLLLATFGGPEGWRWIFYVNLPIGLVALALAARLLPAATRAAWRGVHLDLAGSLLLGGGVLSLLLPLVDATDGGVTRLWPLFGLAVVLLAGFVWWEARTAGRGRVPLLDPQLAHTPGYVPGLAIGSLYFLGFTGIWLVLALSFQDGLGYSPLRSGLAVTPFALGVAASAVVAGRLVARVGRWLTVSGLTITVVGLAATALVLREVGGDRAAWAVVGPLLLAGLGGGLVTSPNVTLTLEAVPVRMAGAAGGALQTATRIGAAVGTALLASVFYRILTSSGHAYPKAVSDALWCACGLMLVALLLAIGELWQRRHRHSQDRPTPQPQHQHLHLG